MITKEGVHALRARIFEICYSKSMTEAEKDQLYEEVCNWLQAIEDQISKPQAPQVKPRVKVKGFAQN